MLCSLFLPSYHSVLIYQNDNLLADRYLCDFGYLVETLGWVLWRRQSPTSFTKIWIWKVSGIISVAKFTSWKITGIRAPGGVFLQKHKVLPATRTLSAIGKIRALYYYAIFPIRRPLYTSCSSIYLPQRERILEYSLPSNDCNKWYSSIDLLT
jgi:hypothetical protein